MNDIPGNSGSEQPIDLDQILYKLRDLFNFTAEAAFDEKFNLVARIQAAQASAQIAAAVSDLINAELMGFMMGFDDPEFGDPSLDPSSWSGGNKPPVTNPDNPAEEDDRISPDELDIE